jgi:hypothetical protein
MHPFFPKGPWPETPSLTLAVAGVFFVRDTIRQSPREALIKAFEGSSEGNIRKSFPLAVGGMAICSARDGDGVGESLRLIRARDLCENPACKSGMHPFFSKGPWSE